MRRKSILCFILLLAASASALAQDCLSYEPAEVELAGRIVRRTFPGPPNYESIRKGDKPETYWILHLHSPICTTASADNEAASNVTDLQLILPPDAYARFRRFVGLKAEVTVTGKLSHATTGHHHTPVLMEVERIGKLNSVVMRVRERSS